MDTESLSAVRLLETVGVCSAKIMGLGSVLQKNEKVISVQRDIDCVTYPITGTTFEIYLDAELTNGNCLNFSLILEWDEKEWVTTTRISLIDQYGSKGIKYFPEKRTEIYDVFLLNMVTATLELVNASEIITQI